MRLVESLTLIVCEFIFSYNHGLFLPALERHLQLPNRFTEYKSVYTNFWKKYTSNALRGVLFREDEVYKYELLNLDLNTLLYNEAYKCVNNLQLCNNSQALIMLYYYLVCRGSYKIHKNIFTPSTVLAQQKLPMIIIFQILV